MALISAMARAEAQQLLKGMIGGLELMASIDGDDEVGGGQRRGERAPARL